MFPENLFRNLQDREKQNLNNYFYHFTSTLFLNFVGIPIRTEVVLYPTPADTGIFVNILRSLIEMHWYHMMAMMLAIDGFMICSLVIVRFKFKALRLYCQEMRTKVLKNVKNKSRMELEKTFKKDFVTVIKMHEDALW